jgi:signal transduction histidine kinase
MADAARLKSGEALALDLEPVNLAEIVRTVVEGTRSTPAGASRTITIEGEAEAVATADAARLQRVVQNLLDNALKYSAAPQPVTLTVEKGESNAALRVRDYGIGIPADELPRVATYEYRATTARRYRGMGIGLAGARRIVELHGGSLTIASAEGAGTTVTVAVPRGDAALIRGHDELGARVNRAGAMSAPRRGRGE